MRPLRSLYEKDLVPVLPRGYFWKFRHGFAANCRQDYFLCLMKKNFLAPSSCADQELILAWEVNEDVIRRVAAKMYERNFRPVPALLVDEYLGDHR